MKEPFELLQKVNSLETFLEFINALMQDKQDEERNEKLKPSSTYSSGQNGWENNDIVSFLSAIHAGTINGGFSKTANWKEFAEIIYLGKVYE